MAEAAFFDLDKTVIAKSSTLAFTGKLYKAGMLGRRTLLRAAMGQLMYIIFGADEDQLDKARDAMLRLTKGWDKQEVERIVEEALEEVVAPLVYAEALFLIDDHVREGRRVFIVSASPEEVVRPLARYIGVEDVIATRAKIDADGLYTGEVEEYAFGPEKAAAVRAVAESEGISLADSYAYSDSITDRPLLELVGHPHAVNPEKELRLLAEERDWPVLDFRRQVSLAKRLTRPVPLISGATVTTVIGAGIAWAMLRKNKKKSGIAWAMLRRKK
ncbi:MAG: HAD-IB family hydrolase [Acidimicrobiia bacterium]